MRSFSAAWSGVLQDAFLVLFKGRLAEVSDFLGVSRMLLEHERDYGLGMDVMVTLCSWNTNEIMVWAWMQRESYALGAEHERDYGLGMDVTVTLCSWSGARRRLWFGHCCKGKRMLLEHERDYGLGMDAKGIVCSRSGARTRLWFGHGCNGNPMLLERSTKEIMVWALL